MTTRRWEAFAKFVRKQKDRRPLTLSISDVLLFSFTETVYQMCCGIWEGRALVVGFASSEIKKVGVVTLVGETS